jgi:hypothetical protein
MELESRKKNEDEKQNAMQWIFGYFLEKEYPRKVKKKILAKHIEFSY